MSPSKAEKTENDYAKTAAPARELEASAPPTASILIPTRNRVDWLKKTLDDVVSQSYAGVAEVIISNNATSKDDTEDYLNRYDLTPFRERGWGVRIYHHRDTLPIQDHWNFLIDISRAPYFSFHMDDDGWDPDFVEAGVQNLVAHPECVVCLLGNRYYYENDADRTFPGWLETWGAQQRAFTAKLDGNGVYSLDRILPVFVSRPPFILTQAFFRRNPRRFDVQDGFHFDFAYLLGVLVEGKVYVDTKERSTLRYSVEAYGHSDIAGTDLENEEFISRACLNIVAKLQAEGVNRAVLTQFARTRALKAANHFVKSLIRRRPNPHHLALSYRLAVGQLAGWRKGNHKKLSATDDAGSAHVSSAG